MEYNLCNTMIKPMSGPLFAQEYTHMNDSAFFLCPDLKTKNKQIDVYQPSWFPGQKGKQSFYFQA